MFIILEGCDKTGKTTLANFLSKRYSWEIIKFSQPKKEAYLEYIEFLLNRKEPAILDRFYLGEKVYAPLWGREVGLNEWQQRMIEMTLMARTSLNIYCETTLDKIEEKFIEDGEKLAETKEIKYIVGGYRRELNKTFLEWNEHDYLRDPELNKIRDLTDEWMANYQYNKYTISALIPLRGIGNPYAETLIVGDNCNGDLEIDKYKHVIMPFAKGASSDYLWVAIDSIPKNKYFLTNAKKYHHQSKIELEVELNLPHIKKIICLGNNAYNYVLDELKNQLPMTKVIRVNHPAYGTRFGISPEEYGETIKKHII